MRRGAVVLVLLFLLAALALSASAERPAEAAEERPFSPGPVWHLGWGVSAAMLTSCAIAAMKPHSPASSGAGSGG